MSSGSDEYSAARKPTPPDRKPTSKLDRPLSTNPLPPRMPIEEAKRLARRAEDDRITMARCPICLGQGMVEPEVAAAVEEMLLAKKDSQ